jgi:hypothetical protein
VFFRLGFESFKYGFRVAAVMGREGLFVDRKLYVGAVYILVWVAEDVK